MQEVDHVVVAEPTIAALAHPKEGKLAAIAKALDRVHVQVQHLGDFGPIAADAAAIPPIIGRGVLIDVAGYREVEQTYARWRAEGLLAPGGRAVLTSPLRSRFTPRDPA